MLEFLNDLKRRYDRKDLDGIRDVSLGFYRDIGSPLSHPEKGVPTFCYSSQIIGMDNVLFFADQFVKSRWLLIQRECLITAIITENEIYNPWALDTAMALSHKLRSGEFDGQWVSPKRFGGFIVSSTRPFHFFYDQIINLPRIVRELDFSNLSIVKGPYCFFDPSVIIDNVRSNSSQNDEYYIFPTIVGANWRRDLHPEDFYYEASEMESRLSFAAPSAEKKYGITLWIGITGQKRSWIEQVEGYASIANELAKNSPVHLLIDGLTAFNGVKGKYPDDQRVVDAILARLHGSITCKNLVGAEYREKISLAKTADAFVTNGGTGAFVPLRVLGLHGVLHTGGGLQAFGNTKYDNRRVYIMGPDQIKDVDHPEYIRADFCSYHARWEEMFNQLIHVTGKLRHLSDLTVPADPFIMSDLEKLGKLHSRLSEGNRVGDVLMDLVKFFEEAGDTHTALALAEQAIIQRQGTNHDALHAAARLKGK